MEWQTAIAIEYEKSNVNSCAFFLILGELHTHTYIHTCKMATRKAKQSKEIKKTRKNKNNKRLTLSAAGH